MSQQYDEALKKCRGRPKTFNRDAALDKALTLFWTHGYEGTSLSDLVAATGAKAPTLYAEFVNKEGLFRAAMERHILTSRQERGDIAAQTDITSLARYLACLLQGMSVRAREGAPQADLDNIIDTLMAMWQVLTGQCRKQN